MKLEINKVVLLAILSLGTFLWTGKKEVLGVYALNPLVNITLKLFSKKKG